MPWGPIPSGRLKNLRDADKWSSFRLLSFNFWEMSVTRELGCTGDARMTEIPLRPVVQGNIRFS